MFKTDVKNLKRFSAAAVLLFSIFLILLALLFFRIERYFILDTYTQKAVVFSHQISVQRKHLATLVTSSKPIVANDIYRVSTDTLALFTQYENDVFNFLVNNLQTVGEQAKKDLLNNFSGFTLQLRDFLSFHYQIASGQSMPANFSAYVDMVGDLTDVTYNTLNSVVRTLDEIQIKLFLDVQVLGLLSLFVLFLFLLLISVFMQSINVQVFNPLILAFNYIRSGKVDKIGKISTQNEYCHDLFSIVGELEDKNKKALNEKSIFLSTMSHEIRTPLNSLVLGLEVLEVEGEENIETYQDIIQSSNFLLAIINNILDYSKIQNDSKLPDLTEEFVSTESFCAQLKGVIYKILNIKGVSVYVYVSQGFPLQLRLNSGGLLQILVNLISNACFHSDTSVIRIRFIRRDDRVLISVTDFGKGLKRTDASSRSQSYLADEKRYSGAGLGLSVCESLTRRMRGSISYVTHKDRGTRFTLQFFDAFELGSDCFVSVINNEIAQGPRQECELVSNYHMFHRMPFTNKPNSLFFSPFDTGVQRTVVQADKLETATRNILVIDDYDINLRVMSKVLKKLNFRYKTLSDVSQAHSVLSNDQFDLILMDIEMPVMNGIDATKWLLAQPDLKQLCIVGLTAATNEELTKKCLEAGMVKVYQKPITSKQLVELANEQFKVNT